MNTPAYFHRLVVASVFLLGLGITPLQAQREKLPPDDREIVEKRWPEAIKTFTGLRFLVLKKAQKDSPSPVPGMSVSVLYKGMLLNGTVFDESADADHPLKSRIGREELIAGWDEALQKMHKGEKWLLIVPPELAYGARGRPPGIPRNATLVFEMELVDFGAN